jgi:hypothetical protein
LLIADLRLTIRDPWFFSVLDAIPLPVSPSRGLYGGGGHPLTLGI